MSECERKGKFVGGCNFEARYDKSPARLDGPWELKGDGSGAMLERFRQITYVRDVCVTCGKTIERSKS